MPKDMVDVKKYKDNPHGMAPSIMGDDYPYGTQLTFKDDMMKDVGMEALAVGDMVEVKGLAKVVSKSEYEEGDMKESSVKLQLTMVKTRRADPDHAEMLYGDK